MTTPPARSDQADRFDWLVNNFAQRIPGVAHAIVISVDGLPLSRSASLSVDRSAQLAAIGCGLFSLANGAASCVDFGAMRHTVVEMRSGLLLLMSIQDGSCLVVLASPHCDIGHVSYEMSVLVEQAGALLTPALRAELSVATEAGWVG
jgi:predicted regulator of Ras-like GTPase activity (Roadblock/LC7/MglB family)